MNPLLMKSVFILLFPCVFYFQTAIACSCNTRERVIVEAYNNYTKIFVGTVLKLSENQIDLIATFRVDIDIKNNISQDTIVIRTCSPKQACCGIDFKIGEKWEIWATSSNYTQTFRSSICGPNRRISQSLESEYFASAHYQSLLNLSQDTGKASWKYKNGVVGATGKLKKGLAVGRWRYFNSEGELKKEGRYKNGLKVGRWKSYQSTNAWRNDLNRLISKEIATQKVPKKLKRQLEKDLPVPKKLRLFHRVHYKKGISHGKDIYYEIDGSLYRLIRYRKGKRHGKSIWVMGNGETSITVYKKGKRVKNES